MLQLFPLLFCVPTVTQAPCDLEVLYLDSPSSLDYFGWATSTLGGVLVVGAPEADGAVPYTGAAGVFVRSAGQYVLQQRLVETLDNDPDSVDGFGFAVAQSGEDIFVGAPFDNSLGYFNQGAVSIFRRQGGSYVQTQQVFPSDLTNGQTFGTALDADGDWVIVGSAAQVDSTFPGGAYFLKRMGGQWVEQQKVHDPRCSAYEDEGWAVAIEGSVALVSALQNDLGQGWGTVFVYERTGGQWFLTATLTDPVLHSIEWSFGATVAIADGRLFIGRLKLYGDAPEEALIYEKTGGSWNLVGSLLPPAGVSLPEFGAAVAASGSRVAVLSRAGIHLFEESGGAWLRIYDHAHPFATEAFHGRPLSLEGSSLCAGDSRDATHGNSSGAAYAWQLAPELDFYCGGEGCPCGNDDPHAGCANSTARGAWLAACGTTSVQADDLILRATALPANQFGLFYMGSGTVNAPFGDGLRCVSPGALGLYRYLPVQSSGPSGEITLGPGIVARSQSFGGLGAIQAGQSWNFQGWFRDPVGSPCGGLFNLTTAVNASFSP